MPKDISEIKEQRKKQLQDKLRSNRGEMEESQKRQMEAVKKQMLKKAMTKEARERLGRIRAANENKAQNLEMLVLQLWKSGQVQGKIDDDQLKQVLKRISSKKKDIEIKRR